MLKSEFLAELHKLDRADKYRVVQLLISDLAVEENPHLVTSVARPPFGSEAAQVLLDALDATKGADQQAPLGR